MPEEKQRKRRIRVEKLDEWIEILKSTEKVNRDSEYFKQNAIRLQLQVSRAIISRIMFLAEQ